MQQEKLKIPALCSQCGELFDMAYDMRRINTEDEFENGELAIAWKNKRKSQPLCWECRSQAY